ncbi:uncharacterized protein LOC121411647 isoform X1 [Lytechinus variegatus]|uniref:uncharacterized protein LOC121411647 isoform X1 n=1 Tax=Lytechinus variegatus TaxID=7654 RepID=UPI001BB0F7E8|nr:uncharacterized protein LOC121411647 isoform X1 [Lytechinus variegatus]
MASGMDMTAVVESMNRMEKLLEKIEDNGRTEEVVHKKRTDGQKVYCRMRVNIITIGDIDTIKEEFTCELALTVKWKEPAIKGMKAEDIDWGEQWDPRIYFFNAVSIDKYEVKKRLGLKSADDDEDDPIPDAQLSIRMKGVFKSSMNLSNFPFDYQDLKIKIMSDWPRKVVEFCKDMSQKDSVRTDTFTGEQEWELQKHVSAKEVEEEKMTSGAVNTYPLYNIVVNVKRKASYYMWNVALIMFLITPLAFTSYAVGADAPEDRLSVTLTLLLTAVAFKFVVSQSLPNTSYQTLLDYYVLWCMTFLCLVVIQNAVASLFPLDKVWEQFDLPTLCVLGGLTVLLNFIFIVVACWKSHKVGSQMQDATNKYNDLCDEIKATKGRGRNYKGTMGEMSIQEERAPLSNPDTIQERGRYDKV